MSDSQAYEAITVASDGVSVTKRFEADEFPVPAIAFQFESTRSEPVSVRLTDVVPEDVAVEDLGFHPEYGSEYWTIDDDQISFERELEAEAEYTTVYGIRATGTDNVEQFLTEPTLENVDPPLEDDEEALVGEGSDAVKDVIAGESDEVPGLEEEEEDVATLELNDPQNEGAGQEGEGAALAGESVVSVLVQEVRNDQVDADDLKLLRRAFDFASDRGSTRARLEKLQEDVDEVLAYSEALETFLDENGTGSEVVEEFQAEVDSFREELEAVRDDVDSVQGDLSSVESELDEVHQTAASNEDELSSVSGTVDEFESRLADLESEVEELKEAGPDAEVEDRIEEIDSEIEDLKSWREQLSSVIGGGD